VSLEASAELSHSETVASKGVNMIERDEDTFNALKEMAEDAQLSSRNYNDELIGLEYYSNLAVLSDEELNLLVSLWHEKYVTCQKEKLASQWMVIQIFILILLAIYVAWVSGGIAGTLISIVGVIAMIAMIEDKRVAVAKRNLSDARQVYQTLGELKQSRQRSYEKQQHPI
jgi:hypothetical protein